jgi:small conductance mechanosensitive channel
MNEVVTQLKTLFEPARIAAGIGALLPKLVVAAVILLVFYLLYRLARSAATFAMNRAKLDLTLQEFIQTMVRYALFGVAGMMALSHVGIDTTSILASLGVAGLTLGFAAKDTLSNVISGLFIFWDRPFVLGDLVEIGGAYGRVESITLRSTRVVTPDGKMLAIPNSSVANGTVTSYTNFPRLRLDVEVTVAVTEDLGRVRRTLLDMVAACDDYSKEPAPEVVVKGLNDYNVLLEVRVWIEDEREHVRLRFQLRESIFRTLTEADVDMPFETLRLAPVEVRTIASSST